MKGKVFVSGIPGSLTLDNEDPLDDGAAILLRILTYVQLTLTANDFKTAKVFAPKEGFDRHSRLIQFDDMKVKGDLLKNTKKLKDLGEEHTLKKVYIKNDQTPLTRKENSRLYGEFKKLIETHNGDRNNRVRLDKGKLYLNNNVVDEFNLANQIF